MEHIHLDITCLACGMRTNSTREVKTNQLLASDIFRANNGRQFAGAKVACVSIVLDHCGECPSTSALAQHLGTGRE